MTQTTPQKKGWFSGSPPIAAAALIALGVNVGSAFGVGPPEGSDLQGWSFGGGSHEAIYLIIICAVLLQSVAIALLAKSLYRRRRADHLLRESEERFRMLAESSPTGIFIIDEYEVIQYANQALIDMFGYQRDQIMGRARFRTLICSEDLPRVLDNFRNRIAGHFATSHYEARALHSNGNQIDIEIYAAMSSGAGAHAVIGTVLDISGRKSAERNIAEQQRDLERTNRTLEQRIEDEVAKSRDKDQMMMQQSRFAAMGEMIGNIAHQWRQPLNMLGIVIQQMQLEQEKGLLTPELLEERVAKGMELLLYLSRTIDDFRNFFRPGVEPRPFKLQKAVAQTIDFFEPSCAHHNIKLTLEGHSSLIHTGHINEFSQALLNILNNARDALLEKELEQPSIVVSLSDDELCSVITVRDNAGGIAPEVMHKIFDPYFTTKPEGKGTGVGLYMTKTIIERNMQGRIRVRNFADGAEFQIIIQPAARTPQPRDGQGGALHEMSHR